MQIRASRNVSGVALGWVNLSAAKATEARRGVCLQKALMGFARHYSGSATQRRPERPIEGPYHRAPGHRYPCDQQEELRLCHRRPEAAEIAGAEVADEAGGEPCAHHHGQIPYRRNLG